MSGSLFETQYVHFTLQSSLKFANISPNVQYILHVWNKLYDLDCHSTAQTADPLLSEDLVDILHIN